VPIRDDWGRTPNFALSWDGSLNHPSPRAKFGVRPQSSLDAGVEHVPDVMLLAGLATAAFEYRVEHFQGLDLRDVEQTPADGVPSERLHAFQLINQQAIDAFLFAVIVRLRDADAAFIANLNKALVRDGEADSRVDRRRRVDEVQHLP
jgi:hypothetical protein